MTPSKEIPAPSRCAESENTPAQTPSVLHSDNPIRPLDQPFLAQNPPQCDLSISAEPPEARNNQGNQDRDRQEVNDDDDYDEDEDKKQRRKKKGHRVDCGPGLMGTSVDSGFSVWDGNAGSPPYATPLHNLWMSYTRSSSYMSSDESESEDEEMWEELQELREKYDTFITHF